VNEIYKKHVSQLLYKRSFKNYQVEIEGLISQLKENNSLEYIISEIYKGQYDDPGGLFYGGNELALSNKTIFEIIEKYTFHAREVLMIDIHSGLGEYGRGELIFCSGANPDALNMAKEIYGKELKYWGEGTAINTPFNGKMMTGVSLSIPKINMTNITLEFGTRDRFSVIKALVAGNIIENYSNFTDIQHMAIRNSIKDAFYPNEERWKEKIIVRFLEVWEKKIEKMDA